MTQHPEPIAPAPLLSAADVRRIAAELDLRPTKQWGQNFVIDPNTIRRIVQAAGVGPEEHVLEIGEYADGVIVGTALVRALGEGGPEAVGRLAAELAGRAG